jgi:hypothetical protein
MSDIDGLKALNKHGYAAGNAAIKADADALRRGRTLKRDYDKAMSSCVVATQVLQGCWASEDLTAHPLQKVLSKLQQKR